MAAAYRDWDALSGSLAQLGVNLTMILVAGTGTLLLQRLLYRRRRRDHLSDRSRLAAGLPLGRSRRHGASEREPV